MTQKQSEDIGLMSEEVKKSREMIKSGKYDECPCPKTYCEWHGKCFECVLIHRVNQDHIPNCLQPMLEKKIQELARVAEMTTQKKKMTPKENWDYVREICPE